jgi:thiamine-phosphate pyrophosphorylase
LTKVLIKDVRENLRLYFIMGSNNCTMDPEYVLEQAIKGGISFFQFREKGTNALTGNEKVIFAKRLQSICQKYSIPFIVNDDVELAISLNADGVHIGQGDESADEVRRKIGDKILGVSAHTVAEVEKAIANGADYVGIGPIYSTTTKEDAKSPQGTTIIKEVRKKGIEIPIVGIGGITVENALPVMESGGNGISIISAISRANDPAESARELKEAIDC